MDTSQVGFGRAVSDGLTFAYLADVYVLPAHRGRGLGEAIVRELVEGGAGRRMRWLLHTADAEAFYARAGFTELLRPRYGDPYKPGVNAFNALLAAWRAKGDLEGLELTGAISR